MTLSPLTIKWTNRRKTTHHATGMTRTNIRMIKNFFGKTNVKLQKLLQQFSELPKQLLKLLKQLFKLLREPLKLLKHFIKMLRELYLIPIKLYGKFLSPLKPLPTCRFTPTCSRYAIDAVREWGIVIGTVLALWRIIRCNPFSKGGYDPVPLRKDISLRKNFSLRKDFFSKR